MHRHCSWDDVGTLIWKNRTKLLYVNAIIVRSSARRQEATNQFTCRSHLSWGLIWGLKPSDLVHVVLDQLRSKELHVSVDSTLTEEFIVVVVLVVASLKHHKMLPLLVRKLGVVLLLNGKLWNVVVDCLLARWCTFQESDWIVRGVYVVQWRVRLASVWNDVFHQVDASHRC